MERVYILSILLPQLKVRFLNIDRLLSTFAALLMLAWCRHFLGGSGRGGVIKRLSLLPGENHTTLSVCFLFCVFDIAVWSLQPTTALVWPKTLKRGNRMQNSFSCTFPTVMTVYGWQKPRLCFCFTLCQCHFFLRSPPLFCLPPKMGKMQQSVSIREMKCWTCCFPGICRVLWIINHVRSGWKM